MRQKIAERFAALRGTTSPALMSTACLLLILAVTLGGSPNRPGLTLIAIQLVCAMLAGLALFSGAWSKLAELSGLQKLFLSLVFVTPLLQLFPLPPVMWQTFPGRALENEILILIGAAENWRPLSLEPWNTLFTWSLMMPAFTMFAATLCLTDRERKWVAFLLIALVAISILIGLFQFGSRGTILNFYNSSHNKFLLGFFANRNHQALMIVVGVIFGLNLIADSRFSSIIALVMVAVVSLVAVFGTSSRMGLFLWLVAVSGCSLMFFSYKNKKTLYSIAILLGVVFVSVFFIAQNKVTSTVFERFDLVGEDGRWLFWKNSFEIIKNYFPYGSGLGSFVAIYQKNETLDEITRLYVNHVHNDYIEFVVETGVLGLAMVGLLVTLILRQSMSGNIFKQPRLVRAAFGATVVIMLHSVVDYPLRTQAIAVVAGFSTAIWFSATSKVRLSAGSPLAAE
ncbi:O-antigen ligase family protein [Parasphingorhabdus sp.]|uniref:O-antigen ligase family protein n=1 Tax=Parasphingorhabdus sp. TaxID=2709688 RepID=UPI003A91BE72